MSRPAMARAPPSSMTALTGNKQRFTYAELQDEVATLAAVLEDLGIAKGDRVLLYMPMIPQAVFAMLACARIGAVHSVVFGGFAPAELATRINDAKPKLIMSASCGLEPGRVIAYKPLIDKAIDIAQHKPASGLVWQRPELAAELTPGRDHDWDARLAATKRKADCVPVAATDPLYVLYTSGTTGQPKGVVRDNGGHMVALKWTMPNIYGIAPGETFWAASDVGWSSAIPISSMRRCSMAPPPSSSKASRSARRMPAPSGASSPSMA